MKVLNASRRTISLMMDNGQILNVAPGELTEMFIASRGAIIAAMNAGSMTEIGIILGGTYEQGISQSVTGCQPYCYLSETEAKARLLDPTIDYKAPMEQMQSSNLKAEILDLQNQLSDRIKDIEILKNKLADSESEIKSLKSDSTTNLQIRELMDKEKTYKEQITKLQSTNEGLQTNYDDMKSNCDKLIIEKDALEGKVKTLSSELNDMADTEHKLKNSLKAAEDRIESMKDLFNKACDKFKLELTPEGEWIQNI